MSIYMCPACGATGKVDGKLCNLCKGNGRVPFAVIQGITKKPKRDIRRTNIETEGKAY